MYGLFVGVIYMREGYDIYVVQPGDTVDGIAQKYGVNVMQIIQDNQMVFPYALAIGQALFIDLGVRLSDRSLRVSGYAYTFISPYVLEQTLPYLSELPIFSYGFTEDGILIPPSRSEDWMIQIAKEYGVQPILTLTPFDESGNFNNQLINSLINNPEAVERLIQNLLEIMRVKDYVGIDIDFEYILAEDRDAFTAFVGRVAEVMRANGFHTSIALAPKSSAEQRGLLYEGKDYAALGAIVDHTLIMTYEWGYTYGPPLAVAPINQVRRVIEYAVTEIPVAKIDLGIPNYGYDWPLPYERGITAATTIGNVQAVQIAITQGVDIQFDEVAQSPYFIYLDGGVEHEVWFEDVRSMEKKFELIKEFDLGGCGYWQIMRWWRANWRLLYKNFYIDK